MASKHRNRRIIISEAKHIQNLQIWDNDIKKNISKYEDMASLWGEHL